MSKPFAIAALACALAPVPVEATGLLKAGFGCGLLSEQSGLTLRAFVGEAGPVGAASSAQFRLGLGFWAGHYRTLATEAAVAMPPVAHMTELNRSRPNPFRSRTEIGFSLSSKSHVRLVVFDVTGRRVRTLLDAKREAGTHQVEWDGRNASGASVSAGIYFYRLEADGRSQTQRALRLR